MKKLVYTAFIAFWTAIATLLSVHALTPDAPTETRHSTPPAFGPTPYTLEQVARHDTLEDCWMAIEGVVYNFTDYVPRHPAPPSVLEPWCGTEATEGMRTKGYGADHSQRAWEMAKNYRIGVLLE